MNTVALGRCQTGWLVGGKYYRAGTACGRPAFYRVSFGEVSFIVCNYHRKQVLKELTRKRVENVEVTKAPKE